MMRKSTYFIVLLLAASMVMLTTCEKKNSEEVDPIVGVYTFSTATLNDTVSLKVPLYGNITLMPGTDAALFVTEGLLGAAPCDDSTNAAVELKNDGKSFFTCLNEDNEAQMGTWLINVERTILTLNISNPQPFSLTISDLDITPASFSGTVENFPLPKDANYELGEDLPEGGGPNIQVKSVDLEFTRVP
jgi:hypothetical protein